MAVAVVKYRLTSVPTERRFSSSARNNQNQSLRVKPSIHHTFQADLVNIFNIKITLDVVIKTPAAYSSNHKTEQTFRF